MFDFFRIEPEWPGVSGDYNAPIYGELNYPHLLKWASFISSKK
jgi:hypothetical protein